MQRVPVALRSVGAEREKKQGKVRRMGYGTAEPTDTDQDCCQRNMKAKCWEKHKQPRHLIVSFLTGVTFLCQPDTYEENANTESKEAAQFFSLTD